MRLPRDVSGTELAKMLKPLGYEVVRQTGSHMQLKTFQNGEHTITIPNHDFIRIGTLSQILSNIGQHFKLNKEEIAEKIFGKI